MQLLRVPISTNFDTYGLYPNSNPPPVHCTATIFIVSTTLTVTNDHHRSANLCGTFNCFSYELINTRPMHIHTPCHYHHLPCLTLYGNPIIIIIIIFLPLAKWYHLNAHQALSRLSHQRENIYQLWTIKQSWCFSLIKILTKLSTLH